MESSCRIAAAQTVPVAGDVVANVRQHLHLIETAAAEQVGLLVFPELSLTGYEPALGPALALTIDDARLEPLKAAAHAHDMTIVVGAPLKWEGKLYLAALVIMPSGEVLPYTKHHLGAFRREDNPDGDIPPPEDAFFSPGTLNPQLEWRGQKLAFSICADGAYPAHTQAAGERGATMYLSSQFAIATHMAFKMARLKQAARRYGFTVLFANYGGATGGLESAGGSCVRTADGEAIARLPEAGCGLAIAWDDGRRWTGKAVLSKR